MPQIYQYYSCHLVNVSLHSVGFYLLFCTYKRGSKTVQKLFLINLSLTECIINFIKFLLLADNLINNDNNEYVIQYVMLVLGSGLYYIYMLTMFFITADRLFGALFPIQYITSVTTSIATRLLIGTWCVNILISVSIALMRKLLTMQVHEIYFPLIYVIGALNVIYLVFGIITYSIIFWKYTTSTRQRKSRPESLFQIFRNSKFYIAILLITSFLLLSVMPYLISTILVIENSDSINMFLFTLPECYVPVTLSDTVDAIIYIFMQVSVRTLLVEKLSHVFYCSNRIPVHSYLEQHRISTITTIGRDVDVSMDGDTFNRHETQRDFEMTEL